MILWPKRGKSGDTVRGEALPGSDQTVVPLSGIQVAKDLVESGRTGKRFQISFWP